MCIRDRDEIELEMEGRWESGEHGTQYQVENFMEVVPRTKEGILGSVSYTHLDVYKRQGTGFNKNLKKYKIKGKSIFDVWKMTLDEAIDFFEDIDKSITKVCITASEIMLGHLQIGQATATLSGGENIRIKIMKASKSTAKVIGVDEPFKGLSNIEIDAVANYLNRIREKGKTLIVIDHSTGVEDYFSQWIQIENIDNRLIGKRFK